MRHQKILASGVLALAFLAMAPATAQTFRLSSETNENSSRTQGGEKFGELLSAASDGDMSVRVFPNAVLTGGDQVKQAEMMGRGDLDFAVTSAITLSTVVPEMSVFSLPYMFEDYEEVDAAVRGEPGEQMKEIAEEHGIKILAWGESGFRQVTNSVRPITSPDDMQALKLRVAGPMFIDIMNNLGANPQQIQWTETFSALQQGVVDGQENPVGAVIVPQRIYEVQNYLTTWNYSYDPAFLIMSLEVWDELSSDQQQIVQQAAEEAMAWQKELTRQQTAEGLELLREEGVEIYDPTEDEIARFREATQPSFDKWSEQVGEDLVKTFQAAIEQGS